MASALSQGADRAMAVRLSQGADCPVAASFSGAGHVTRAGISETGSPLVFERTGFCKFKK